MIIERKNIPFDTGISNIKEAVIKSEQAVRNIHALVADCNIFKGHILHKKEAIMTNYKGDIMRIISNAKAVCSEINSNADRCTDTNNHACDQIKTTLIKTLEAHNALVAQYIDNADYKQLKACSIEGLNTLETKDIVGKSDLDSIDCDLTTPPERNMHQENVLLAQETRTKELIKVEEENKASKIQSQAIANDKENLETHKQGLYVAKAGEKDSIVITCFSNKISQIDKSTIVDIVLEQCKNIIHNFNPLEGDTIDISQCGKYKVSQISFRTFTTDKTATDQIPISCVKVDGK